MVYWYKQSKVIEEIPFEQSWQSSTKPSQLQVLPKISYVTLLIISSEAYYFDGKKCDTLVRETKCVNVQVN